MSTIALLLLVNAITQSTAAGRSTSGTSSTGSTILHELDSMTSRKDVRSTIATIHTANRHSIHVSVSQTARFVAV